MKSIASTTLCRMRAEEFIQMLDEEIYQVTLDKRIIGTATKEKPENMSKVMTFSCFKRSDKKELSRALKRGSIEVVAGFGKNKEKSFFFVKK